MDYIKFDKKNAFAWWKSLTHANKETIFLQYRDELGLGNDFSDLSVSEIIHIHSKVAAKFRLVVAKKEINNMFKNILHYNTYTNWA